MLKGIQVGLIVAGLCVVATRGVMAHEAMKTSTMTAENAACAELTPGGYYAIVALVVDPSDPTKSRNVFCDRRGHYKGEFPNGQQDFRKP